jgi:hypothetical protein
VGGFLHKDGINYGEVFSPAAIMETSSFNCKPEELENPSNGCQVNIFDWPCRGRSVCQATCQILNVNISHGHNSNRKSEKLSSKNDQLVKTWY